MTYAEAVEVVEYLGKRGLRFFAWGTAYTWDWAKVEAHYCALVQGEYPR
ncbi:hypothetical protein LCGC14_0294410 [marine sediment metagenome]|uniref:Uncharacterized protein n=1 Tax=marine sediment metagenome TaxID=412755 RepID=A0A0F9WXR5_9ZZZZ